MLLFRSLPEIRTPRTVLRLLEPQRAPLMVQFRVENREHLLPWEPRRSPEFYTRSFWEHQLRFLIQDYRDGNSLCLSILDREETEVMGVCNFTNIVRGTFMACQLGYALARKHQGQGVMFEALQGAIQYVFDELGLHRIMAAYIPRNERSGNLLARLNFVKEGVAERYLQIDGRWEDHVLTSLINPADGA